MKFNSEPKEILGKRTGKETDLLVQKGLEEGKRKAAKTKNAGGKYCGGL
ncbi:hypothetical protein MM300_22475 [Evansella sp. LMS18]|nr:hypothetical protein [Evansella sp. LMS18]UTR10594.1 hypothetical protein MM300_22475 [Evansella sp. LMS18]